MLKGHLPEKVCRMLQLIQDPRNQRIAHCLTSMEVCSHIILTANSLHRLSLQSRLCEDRQKCLNMADLFIRGVYIYAHTFTYMYVCMYIDRPKLIVPCHSKKATTHWCFTRVLHKNETAAGKNRWGCGLHHIHNQQCKPRLRESVQTLPAFLAPS